MKVRKTTDEINERIKNGEAVVLTAEEVKKMAEESGTEQVAKKVDVVTTATFGPMCSSGAFINFANVEPPIRMSKVWLNDVPVFAGLAAADAYIGASEISEIDPNYGGAHIIEDLIRGKKIKLRAIGTGTDCYPRKNLETEIDKDMINECYLFNPRNCYQNYSAATNSSKKTLYTYMGILLPRFGNISYSTTGEMSPLVNDPELRTIGIGTSIFLAGAQGYVIWNGTQFNTETEKENNIPVGPGATLAVIGNLKKMNPEFIKPAIIERYGISLFVGIGVPIPILDEDMAKFVSIRDKDIKTVLCDYGRSGHPVISKLTYKELKSGEANIKGKKIRTAPTSSIYVARKIAEELKTWLKNGKFLLSSPVGHLPKKVVFKKLTIPKET